MVIAKVSAGIRQLLIFGSHRAKYGRGGEEFLDLIVLEARRGQSLLLRRSSAYFDGVLTGLNLCLLIRRRTPLPINISATMKIKQSVRRRWMLRRLRNGLLPVACLIHP